MPLTTLKLNVLALRNKMIAQHRESFTATSHKRLMSYLVIGIIVFGIGYFAEINSLSTKGFVLKGLESRKAELVQQEKELQVQLAESRSTESIMKKIEGLNMVAVAKVNYIKVGSSDVAMAK